MSRCWQRVIAGGGRGGEEFAMYLKIVVLYGAGCFQLIVWYLHDYFVVEKALR